MVQNQKLQKLREQLKGELFLDDAMKTLYATDASAYREMPLAVAIPENAEDLKKLIAFCRIEKTSLIPRAAGTSLAGQVVGNGIVVDVSRKFTRILEINSEESWVRLEPGVVRDELNRFLKDHGLFFGPETSTANRAMIGGMVGNNSCGSNSVVYGSTREHLLEVKALLADGTEVVFGDLSDDEFMEKVNNPEASLENKLYKSAYDILHNKDNQNEIVEHFPKPSIPRRNTGYALDLLLDSSVFQEGNKKPFNFCKLIAGSEGTLALITEIKIHCDPMPPQHKILVCGHFETIDDSLRANLIALKYNPSACELMDHYVLERTKTNIEQVKNRFFVKGDPDAILVVELTGDDLEEVKVRGEKMSAEMQAAGFGYHFPVVGGEDIKKVWNLRKAGLGLLSNIPGDAKPAPVIEDTAVDVQDLPAYIADFNEVLKKYDLFCVHYAHAGSGELHLRPILDLKTHEGNEMFKTIATEIAHLVKKYRGSLSGEHGDGRLRGEFIQFMVGEKNYKLLEKVKHDWDVENIFNPGKIVDTPSMNSMLRYEPGMITPEIDTVYDFSDDQGIIRAAELCNGSGDCRKSELTGGTMCPSYMATRDEKDTTRARANILREYLTQSEKPNKFDHQEIKKVLDLCLSCKGCKSECPSNVDMAKLKGEFLQHYQDANGVSFGTRMISEFAASSKFASIVPGVYNFMAKNSVTSSILKSMMGMAPQRSIPTMHQYTLTGWYKKNKKRGTSTKRKVYLFADEFTEYNDTDIGVLAVQLLEKLGYEVIIPKHIESGRTYMSKGMIRKAKEVVVKNINLLKDLVTEDTPLIGIEPSAILSFRDEYLALAMPYQKEAAKELGENALMFDEFIEREIKDGKISSDLFTKEKKLIKYHGHCHQKALSSLVPTKKMLSLPINYEVQLIPSGCCGMAGSFGYEKEHYEVSMNVGELVLFPTVRKQPQDVIIAAPGTSCRHQIADGTGRKALHPIEILWNALV